MEISQQNRCGVITIADVHSPELSAATLPSKTSSSISLLQPMDSNHCHMHVHIGNVPSSLESEISPHKKSSIKDCVAVASAPCNNPSKQSSFTIRVIRSSSPDAIGGDRCKIIASNLFQLDCLIDSSTSAT